MGTMPLGKLLISMSVPMMISMFIQALYNTVDSMFVARISEDALTAVSIAFPVQSIMIALGVGLGVGVNAVVPRYLGMGKREEAEKAANITVFLSTCFIVLFILLGIFACRPFFLAQTRDPSVVSAGMQYLPIVCVLGIGAFYGQNFEKMLVAFGFTVQSMASQALGAITNIILDPLLIFGIGPFPKLGVAGAAYATVIGQILAAALALWFLTRETVPIRLRLSRMRPEAAIVKEIMKISVPSMLTIGLTSVMSFAMNQILLTFSKTATAVFGIWLKLQSFVNMPLFGMNNGSVPILSYNLGAKRLDRVNGTIRIALLIGLSWMAAATIPFMLVPDRLLFLFDASEHMLSIGIPALRIASISFVFAGVSVILNSSFQALGHAGYALFTNFCRQLVFLIPLAWLLSRTGNVDNVWFSIALSEVLSMIVSVILRRRVKAETAGISAAA